MEVTQFTLQEYNDSKSGKKSESEIKAKAMDQLSLLEKDPKSDFNLKFGGIRNMRRVRIVRDSEDASGEVGPDNLVFDVRDQPRILAQKRAQEAVEKSKGKEVAFPLFIPDVKLTVASLLKRAAETAAKTEGSQDFVSALDAVRTKIEEEKTVDGMRMHRVEVMKLTSFVDNGLIADSDSNREDKKTIYACLDASQAALALIHRLGVMFDKDLIIEYANALRPKRFYGHKHKKFTPRQDNRGPVKAEQ